MTDKSYPPPCRNYLQPLYLSVTLYACAQRANVERPDPATFRSDWAYDKHLNPDFTKRVLESVTTHDQTTWQI